MAAQVTNYKCPACTGPLHFAEKSGKLECDYCGSIFDAEEIEALYADEEAKAAAEQHRQEAKQKEPQWDTSAAGSGWGAESEHMRTYSCPSCGGEIICDETTAATSCPYCGNPAIDPGKFEGTLRPDFVLPFRLSKKDAVKALEAHYKGKILLPKAFTAHNHVEEIKGIYVPFWLFDGVADADMTFHATNSMTHREGDYRVTDTQHYEIRRSGTIAFEKVPVDGSSKMSDDFMDSIEPFDYSELIPFSTAYLPGYLADKYDVDAKEASARAGDRCYETVVSALRDTVIGYQTVSERAEQVELHPGKVHYALLPVWLLSTRWKDQNYLFAMNGQTGKMVGDLPADKGKLHAWFWCTAVGASAVFSLLALLISGFFA